MGEMNRLDQQESDVTHGKDEEMRVLKDMNEMAEPLERKGPME